MLLRDEKSKFTKWIRDLHNDYKNEFDIYDKGNRRVKIESPKNAGFLIDVFRFDPNKLLKL